MGYVLYVKYEDERVKKLFDDLNDVQNSNNLMKRQIGMELTKAVKKKYNQLISFTSFGSLIEAIIGKME